MLLSLRPMQMPDSVPWLQRSFRGNTCFSCIFVCRNCGSCPCIPCDGKDWSCSTEAVDDTTLGTQWCTLAHSDHVYVQRVLEISSHNIHAWTDSTVVLPWLNGDPRRFKTFISNRVTQIVKHVPSQNGSMCVMRTSPFWATDTPPLVEWSSLVKPSCLPLASHWLVSSAWYFWGWWHHPLPDEHKSAKQCPWSEAVLQLWMTEVHGSPDLWTSACIPTRQRWKGCSFHYQGLCYM